MPISALKKHKVAPSCTKLNHLYRGKNLPARIVAWILPGVERDWSVPKLPYNTAHITCIYQSSDPSQAEGFFTGNTCAHEYERSVNCKLSCLELLQTSMAMLSVVFHWTWESFKPWTVSGRCFTFANHKVVAIFCFWLKEHNTAIQRTWPSRPIYYGPLTQRMMSLPDLHHGVVRRPRQQEQGQVFSEETAGLLQNILADLLSSDKHTPRHPIVLTGKDGCFLIRDRV